MQAITRHFLHYHYAIYDLSGCSIAASIATPCIVHMVAFFFAFTNKEGLTDRYHSYKPTSY